jgi:hypothetical protein
VATTHIHSHKKTSDLNGKVWRAKYFKTKTTHFYSQYICDAKCELKKEYFGIATLYRQTRKKLFELNKKLHKADNDLVNYNKLQIEAEHLTDKQASIRETHKYTLLKERVQSEKKLWETSRDIYKKELADQLVSKRAAYSKLEIAQQKEINAIAKSAAKKRAALVAAEKAHKAHDFLVGNYWQVNHLRMSVLRSEKKYRTRLHFQFKRNVHHLSALIRKRQRLQAYGIKVAERDAKNRASVKEQTTKVADLEKSLTGADASTKAAIQAAIAVAKQKITHDEKIAKLSADMTKKTQTQIKEIDTKLKDIVEKKILNLRVKQFPKRITEQIKAQQARNQVQNPRLYAYYDRLLKKSEKEGSFFLVQPSKKDAIYVCTTTEDLVEKKASTEKSDLDPIVRNVMLRPLVCFTKDAVQISAVYNTVSTDDKPLKIQTSPSAFRQVRLSLKKVGKKLSFTVQKSAQVLDPEYKKSVKVVEMAVDKDVRNYMKSHQRTAKQLLKSFIIERVAFPSEPFVLKTKSVAL